MHPLIRQNAQNHGYSEADGTLTILPCGVEELDASSTRVDTVISVLTLCTVPRPNATIPTMIQTVLKPGGLLLYYEHVLSSKSDVAWWQRFWAPMWTIFFDGCRMDRPTHLWVERMKRDDGSEKSMWVDGERWNKLGESEENLFFHQAGRYQKYSE